MFDHTDTVVGLSEEIGYGYLASGESHDIEVDLRVAHEVTCLELADGWAEPDRHLLPGNLDSIPLPFLGLIVGGVDRSKLNGFDLVRLLETEARLESSFAARKMASIAEVAYCPPGNADSPVERSPNEVEYAAAEIATALTMTRRRSESVLSLALSLTGETLARVWERYSSGALSYEKVRTFVSVLGSHTDEVVELVLDQVLDEAESLTSGQLGHRLRSLVLEADPSGVGHGMAEGLKERRVVSYQNPDLTGSIGILSGHPDDIAAARAHIEGLARSLKKGDEARTMDQLRHDVALDLLKGVMFDARAVKGRVVVTIPAATLEAAGSTPGALEGFGPVTAEIARKAALDCVEGDWEYQVTDNGRVVSTGTLSRSARPNQGRRVRSTYPTCVFPGCRQPSFQCDLDHRRPHGQGGRTHLDNLAPLCRHHHMVRHHTPWEYQRLENGDHQWTSPLGHVHVRRRGPPG